MCIDKDTEKEVRARKRIPRKEGKTVKTPDQLLSVLMTAIPQLQALVNDIPPPTIATDFPITP